jgi:hypothetical protein
LSAPAANCAGEPAAKEATSVSFCTDSTLPDCPSTMRPASEKNSLASASTLAASNISDMRVKLRSSAWTMAAGRRSVCMARGYQAAARGPYRFVR